MSSAPSPPDPEEDRTVLLPVNAATVTAEEIKVRLVLAADLGDEICIDASRVESVGQAAMQLLLAARIDADRQGQPFTVCKRSAAFIERLDACRLAGPLGLETRKDFQ